MSRASRGGSWDRRRRRLVPALGALAVGLATTPAFAILPQGPKRAPPPPTVPDVPDWGAFEGAPPDFAPPPGGTTQTIAAGEREVVLIRRPSGTPFARADVGERGVETVRFYDRLGRLDVIVSALRAASEAPAKREQSRCGVDQRRSGGFRWRRPIGWRFVARSTPGGVNVTRTQGALRNARVEWEMNRNHCGIPDRSSVDFRFRGRTGTGLGNNGVSTVGFGETDTIGGACVGTIACTITWTRGTTAEESDTRFDHDRRWGNLGQPGRFDVQGVAAHETGHTLGFEHVASNDNVMECCARVGDTTDRLLGRGDANENNARY
jgi:hypothetical protein